MTGNAPQSSPALMTAKSSGMGLVIPPKRCRKLTQICDAALYRGRHPVENGFGKYRVWRTWRCAGYETRRCRPKRFDDRL